MRSFFGLITLFILGACHNADITWHAPKAGVIEITPVRADARPRVLAVVAHPDDETVFAATCYKIATHLGGAVDIFQITNGEGGFKYSTLAEPLYQLELTDEAVGRAHLPSIRRREFLAGCRIMHVRRGIFLNQKDHRYTQDPKEVLDSDAGVWDLPYIRASLDRILAEHYDFVFTHLPTADTHGHHQAATLLALEAVAKIPAPQRPAILGATVNTTLTPDQTAPFSELPGYPITRVSITPGPPLTFFRTQTFGYKDRLDYRIIVNWVIAEHKSQGTMQLAANRGELERFYLFDINAPHAVERSAALFERLAEPQFTAKTYGPSAGTSQ